LQEKATAANATRIRYFLIMVKVKHLLINKKSIPASAGMLF
jgi:hypothetical protein